MAIVKMPHIRVTIASRAGVLLDKVITAAPSDGQEAVVRHQTGSAEYYGLTVRRKTAGDLFVTAREPRNTTHFAVPSGQSVQVPHLNDIYTITNTVLEASSTLEALVFRAPHATIEGRPEGWLVTFRPDQRPCVLTLAIPPLKDESIPSFPFPAEVAAVGASWLLPMNQFGAVAGGPLRLGVRGAGLAAQLVLPLVGKTHNVLPEHFKLVGAPNTALLDNNYVRTKYAEKRNLLSWL